MWLMVMKNAAETPDKNCYLKLSSFWMWTSCVQMTMTILGKFVQLYFSSFFKLFDYWYSEILTWCIVGYFCWSVWHWSLFTTILNPSLNMTKSYLFTNPYFKFTSNSILSLNSLSWLSIHGCILYIFRDVHRCTIWQLYMNKYLIWVWFGYILN